MRLVSSFSIQMIYVDEIMFNRGGKYFQKHSDKYFPLTDCVSFVVMDQFNIRTALTFDKHFVQAGFDQLPL